MFSLVWWKRLRCYPINKPRCIKRVVFIVCIQVNVELRFVEAERTPGVIWQNAAMDNQIRAIVLPARLREQYFFCSLCDLCH